VCPDLGIKYQAAAFLTREFAPKTPVETEEELQRRAAHVEIAAILQSKGIAPPEDPPIEMEVVSEGDETQE
jgi:hypothetical protein